MQTPKRIRTSARRFVPCGGQAGRQTVRPAVNIAKRKLPEPMLAQQIAAVRAQCEAVLDEPYWAGGGSLLGIVVGLFGRSILPH